MKANYNSGTISTRPRSGNHGYLWSATVAKIQTSFDAPYFLSYVIYKQFFRLNSLYVTQVLGNLSKTKKPSFGCSASRYEVHDRLQNLDHAFRFFLPIL